MSIADLIIYTTRPLTIIAVVAYIGVYFYSSHDLSRRGYDDARVNERYSAASLALVYLLVTFFLYENVALLDEQNKEVMFLVRLFWLNFYTVNTFYELRNISERNLFGKPILTHIKN